jgi:hypothetical protein
MPDAVTTIKKNGNIIDGIMEEEILLIIHQ